MRHSLRTGREELTVLRFGILGGDSLFLALLTMGEGYHNYHHEFQHDYRNGVKPWQFDPTKWLIWTLSKLGLTRNLRRVRLHLREIRPDGGVDREVRDDSPSEVSA